VTTGTIHTGYHHPAPCVLQVLCNGGVPTLIALTYGILVGCMDVPLGPSPHSEVCFVFLNSDRCFVETP
jgi:hypothetical protein